MNPQQTTLSSFPTQQSQQQHWLLQTLPNLTNIQTVTHNDITNDTGFACVWCFAALML